MAHWSVLASFFVPVLLQAAGTYYDELDTTKPLRYALHDLIDDHTVVPYSSSSPDAKDAFSTLDVDPVTPGNVILIYSRRSNLLDVSDVNREHLWPNSYGLDSVPPAYSDLHNLKPCDSNVNSSRGNKVYDVSDRNADSFRTPGHAEAPGTTADSDSWEPPPEVRGDVARAAFYMATRYIGDVIGEPDLVLTDDLTKVDANSNYFGKLSTLLQWHEDDPPDDQERQRNDLVHQNFQGNRNPYIDHPEYAAMVFNDHTDIDGDGLDNFDEVFAHRTDPTKADTNGDGISDGKMVETGVPPNINLRPLFDSIIQETHFRAGGVVVERVGDSYQIKLTIEKSDDLKSWTTHQEETILIDAGAGKQFLRVKVE